MILNGPFWFFYNVIQKYCVYVHVSIFFMNFKKYYYKISIVQL